MDILENTPHRLRFKVSENNRFLFILGVIFSAFALFFIWGGFDSFSSDPLCHKSPLVCIGILVLGLIFSILPILVFGGAMISDHKTKKTLYLFDSDKQQITIDSFSRHFLTRKQTYEQKILPFSHIKQMIIRDSVDNDDIHFYSLEAHLEYCTPPSSLMDSEYLPILNNEKRLTEVNNLASLIANIMDIPIKTVPHQPM